MKIPFLVIPRRAKAMKSVFCVIEITEIAFARDGFSRARLSTDAYGVMLVTFILTLPTSGNDNCQRENVEHLLEIWD